MTIKYLLPCECGASVPVDPAQAGQSVPCSCGRQLAVPALRAVRQLPRCEAEKGPAPAPARRWNATQGALFGLGAAVTLASLTFAGYCAFRRWHIDTRLPSAEFTQKWVGEVDAWTPEEMYGFWRVAREFGLPPGISVLTADRREAARLNRNILVGAVLALGGVALAFSSLFLGTARRHR